MGYYLIPIDTLYNTLDRGREGGHMHTTSTFVWEGLFFTLARHRQTDRAHHSPFLLPLHAEVGAQGGVNSSNSGHGSRWVCWVGLGRGWWWYVVDVVVVVVVMVIHRSGLHVNSPQ